jgi:starch phosphorylase
MVRDYVVQLYAPAASSSRAMAADGFAAARDVATWTTRVRDAWPGVRVSHVESSGVADAPELGQRLELRAVVELGQLTPDDVMVQVAFGAVDEHDELSEPELAELQLREQVDAAWRYEGTVPLDRRGAFGYTVRVLPRHPSFAAAAELGLIALPVESTAYTAV